MHTHHPAPNHNRQRQASRSVTADLKSPSSHRIARPMSRRGSGRTLDLEVDEGVACGVGLRVALEAPLEVLREAAQLAFLCDAQQPSPRHATPPQAAQTSGREAKDEARAMRSHMRACIARVPAKSGRDVDEKGMVEEATSMARSHCLVKRMFSASERICTGNALTSAIVWSPPLPAPAPREARQRSRSTCRVRFISAARLVHNTHAGKKASR